MASYWDGPESSDPKKEFPRQRTSPPILRRKGTLALVRTGIALPRSSEMPADQLESALGKSTVKRITEGDVSPVARIVNKAARKGFAAKTWHFNAAAREVDSTLVSFVRTMLDTKLIDHRTLADITTFHRLATQDYPHESTGMTFPNLSSPVDALYLKNMIEAHGSQPVGLIHEDGGSVGMAMPTRYPNTLAYLAVSPLATGSATATVAIASYR